MCWRVYWDHRGCRRQRGPQRRESSVGIASDLGVYCKNQINTYDRGEGGFDLEFLVNPPVLDGVVSQLVIVFVPFTSFEDTRREVL